MLEKVQDKTPKKIQEKEVINTQVGPVPYLPLQSMMTPVTRSPPSTRPTAAHTHSVVLGRDQVREQVLTQGQADGVTNI